MSKKNVNIILACNNNYIPYLAVTLQSIILTADSERVYNVNILHTRVTEENIAKICQMSTLNVKVSFVNVSQLIADKALYTKHHISEETYYRALIPEIFPKLEKVLYIDCDLVANRDLAILYDLDIRNYYIGAVKNFNNYRMTKYISEEIGIDPREYFNAGVLLINLREFRKKHIEARFFELVAGDKEFNLMDQDILNILCNKKVLYMDPRWNVSWQHVFQHNDDQRIVEEYKEEYNRIIAEPYIVHYTTEKKAWDYSDLPLADYFWRVAKQNEIFMQDYKKERILLVTHEMDYAGSEHSLKRVCVALLGAGYKVDVWSYQHGDFANEFKKIDVQVKFINKNKLGNVENQEVFKRYCLVIANTIATYDVVNAAQDIVPVIWYIREGQNIPQFYRTNRKMYETLYRAYCIYTVSEYAGDYIAEKYNPNVEVLHNCVDDEYEVYGNDRVADKGKVKLLTLGTIEERKGYDIYFHAYMSLPSQYRDRMEIHFAGRTVKWANEYAEKLFREIEPYQNIIYHGEIQDRGALLKLVNDVDVVVVASRDESCSLVALEGAMMKKPLVVTENVGAKYIVNSDNGWVVKTGDTEAMAKAYVEIIESMSKLKAMGEVSRRNYLETSTYEMFEKRILQMVEKNKCRDMAHFTARKKTAKERLYEINQEDYPMQLVTYDIFDTLITRMTATPKGTFAIMQYELLSNAKYNKKSKYIRENFYQLRVNAEACARNALISRQKDEVSLDEIYSALNMTQEMSYLSMKELEELERSVEYAISLPINSMVQEVAEKIKAKLPISYVSDMYLEKEFIRRLLHKANSEISSRKIYVSSAYNKSKASGSLYALIRREEMVREGEWLHIGDNERSDFEVAAKHGIKAQKFDGSRMLQWEKDLIEGAEDDVYLQLAVGATKNARINSMYHSMPFYVGVSIGAISVYSYVRWVLYKAQKDGINRLYFVARDGYVLKIIADKIIESKGYNIKTKYIYGSRLTWRLPAVNVDSGVLDVMLKESLPHFVNKLEDFAEIFGLSTDELCKFLPNSYRNLESELNLTDVSKMKQYLLENRKFREYIALKQKEKCERVKAYMQQEVDFSDDGFAFVELNGSGFTQYCLSTILSTIYKGKIQTFFLKLNSIKKYENENISLIGYFPNNMRFAHVIEALCRAPHGQTYDYEVRNGKYHPLLEQTEGESLMEYGFNDYAEGISAFTEYMVKAEKATGIAVTSCNLTRKCLEYLSNNPAKEIWDYIGDIPFGPTGREKCKVTFAPRLTDTQIEDIYLKNKKLQTVYMGAAFDISLMRCTVEQLKKIEEYKKRGEENRVKNLKWSLKDQRSNKNWISQGNLAKYKPDFDVETVVTQATAYSNEVYVQCPELFKIGDYISVISPRSNSIKLYCGCIEQVIGNRILFDGKTISAKKNDRVVLNEICVKKMQMNRMGEWNIHSNGQGGKIVKMRTGIMISKPSAEKFSVLRFGIVLPVPHELRGKNVTLSLRCSNVINEPQLCFTSKEENISLASVDMLDDTNVIKEDGIAEVKTFIPEHDNFMRIMIQIPSKNEARILIQEIKLEEGKHSTIKHSAQRDLKTTGLMILSNARSATKYLKKNGVKYALNRLKDIMKGME